MKPIINPYKKREHTVSAVVTNVIQDAIPVVVPVAAANNNHQNTTIVPVVVTPPPKKKQKLDSTITTTSSATTRSSTCRKTIGRKSPRLLSTVMMKTSIAVSPAKINELKPIAIGRSSSIPTNSHNIHSKSDSIVGSSSSSSRHKSSSISISSSSAATTGSIMKGKRGVVGVKKNSMMLVKNDSVQLKRRKRCTTLLGRLRTRNGITFEWIKPPLQDENYDIGRVYYPSFVFGNSKKKKPASTFCVGDIVGIKTDEIKKEEVVRIVSVYQATKSYTGYPYANHDDGPIEIQKRGHPYMEVQLLNKHDPEIIGDWLLDASLEMRKFNNIDRQKVVVAKKSMHWDPVLEATRVHYYKTNKSDQYPADFEQIQNGDDTDSCKSIDS